MHHRKYTKTVVSHTITLNVDDIQRALYEYALKGTSFGGRHGLIRRKESPYWQASAEDSPRIVSDICGRMSAGSAVQLVFETESDSGVEETGSIP